MHSSIKKLPILFAIFLFTNCGFVDAAKDAKADDLRAAPGAPGAKPSWAYAGKTGIGTSYEQYVDGGYADSDEGTGIVSKVWFSLADGIVTETMYGLIHQAQIKDMQLLMVGDQRVDTEQFHTTSAIEYLVTDESGRALAPAYKIVNTDKEGQYRIEKHVFTDPDRQVLWLRYVIEVTDSAWTPVLTVNPHVDNDGIGDFAWVDDTGMHASDRSAALSLKSSVALVQQSVGFVGVSDAWTDAQDFRMDTLFDSTADQRGNVALSATLPAVKHGQSFSVDFVIGFGENAEDSANAAAASLKEGYQSVLDRYVGRGDAVGWSDYLSSLTQLSNLAAMSMDDGALLHASALVLKVQEDKTYAGALIASLSNPWGDWVSAEQGHTGYKAVWPRDFYQCAMALLALGDKATPKVAFEYLKQIQVDDSMVGNRGAGGWFLQKTQVNGVREWVSVQLDQTAMPIMLAWKLWRNGVLSDAEIERWYTTMLKPAADFLLAGGGVAIDGNEATVIPPYTQQERWEEQRGYSPSSTAATIAGLVSAAEIAGFVGDEDSRKSYLEAADRYEESIENTMFTTSGKHNHNGRYFLRITQNDDPNDNGELEDRNGQGVLREKDILDAGFLELVRYGVRAADDAHIVDSLEELDDMTLDDDLRVKYAFQFGDDEQSYFGWRRYGQDGYGENQVTGKGYGASDGEGGMSPDQRGRVWPFFTGERAHYELAAGKDVAAIRKSHVRALEHFANDGLMLPEQVFDGVGVNPDEASVTDIGTPIRYHIGEGTNAATPLAWTHAEYVKLLRSLSDEAVWDFYPPVAARYRTQ